MLALTKNDKNTNINWYINFIWRYLKKSLVRSSFIILPSTILRTTSGGGKVSAGSGGHFVYKNGGLGQWDSATLDFGAPCSAGYAQVTFHVDGYNNASRQDHYIEASNDNSSWIRIAYLGSNPRDRDGAGRIHGSVSGYRFVRIRCECGNVNFRVHGYMIAGIVA